MDTPAKWQDLDQTPCSIARSLAVLGDRWTLLILRNAFLRTRRFDDFQKQLGITRHLLASRLRRLVEQQVFEKVPYQHTPLRHEYRLTERGRALYPVLLAMTRWGDQWLAGGHGPPVEHIHKRCGKKTQPTMVCSECGEPIDAREMTPIAGPGLRGTAVSRRKSPARESLG